MLAAWTLSAISTNPDWAAGGRPNARTRVVAICPRVTASLGQNRAGLVPQPDTIPRSASTSTWGAHHMSASTSENRDEADDGSGVSPTARLIHTAITHRGSGSSQQPRPKHRVPSKTPPLPKSVRYCPTHIVSTGTRAGLHHSERSGHNHQDHRRQPPTPHTSHHDAYPPANATAPLLAGTNQPDPEAAGIHTSRCGSCPTLAF